MEDQPVDAADYSKWRQGDVFSMRTVAILTESGPELLPAPHGVVVMSQTCDVVRCEGLHVTVCPLVKLDADDRRNAERGTKPGYAAVPEAGDGMFADFALASPVASRHLAKHSRTVGIDPNDLEEVRRFGERVARHFGRFAFPDDVVPWLDGLRDVVLDKHDLSTSAEGELIRRCVAEFRVEASAPNFWSTPPYSVTLVVIVKRGVLPEFDDPPPLPKGLERKLAGAQGAFAMAEWLREAESLADSSEARATRWHLWQSLADAWAAKCRPAKKHLTMPGVAAAISEGALTSEIVTADQFTYERYRGSEQLDVQHLSPPGPVDEL